MSPTCPLTRLCVFAGSGEGCHPDYLQAAALLGRELARQRIALVYGGARIGLMGRAADAALEAGGEVIGVIPEALVGAEVAHEDLTDLRVVGSMHERKSEMGLLADGFLALPGGLGTFEELLEAATWSQLGIHAKPCGALNVRRYFDQLALLLDRAVEEEFLSSRHRQIVLVEDRLQTLLRRICEWEPPVARR